MLTFINYRRLLGLWVVLFALASLSVAQAQSQAIRIRGKACTPDQECKADSLVFTDSIQTGVTTRVWDFGDNSTVTKQNDSIARHVYQRPGPYTVRLTRTVSGTTIVSERSIVISTPPSPFPNWRTDTTICKGEKITPDPYQGGSAPPGTTF